MPFSLLLFCVFLAKAFNQSFLVSVLTVGSVPCKQIRTLSQELQCVRGEKETLLTAGTQSSSEEFEKLLSALASVSAERDQLKMDLQENVEMVSYHSIALPVQTLK